jgi:hypothetical protein
VTVNNWGGKRRQERNWLPKPNKDMQASGDGAEVVLILKGLCKILRAAFSTAAYECVQRRARSFETILLHWWLTGTIRPACLDSLIPLGKGHLRRILREWSNHHNRGRPHSALGPGIPEPPEPRFRPAANATASQMGVALPRALFSEAYTMNTGWNRRLREVAK